MEERIEIPIQLSRQLWGALYTAYDFIVDDFVPEDDYEHMLHANAWDMRWNIEHLLLLKWKKSKTMVWTWPQALAFWRLLNGYGLDNIPLSKIAVENVLKQIDKLVKNTKILNTATNKI